MKRTGSGFLYLPTPRFERTSRPSFSDENWAFLFGLSGYLARAEISIN